MKQKLLLIILLITASCQRDENNEQTVSYRHLTPTLFIHVVDLSKSTTQLSVYNDTGIARSIYTTIAYQGGGVIKVVYIGATSLDEEVETIPVIAFDTVRLDTIHNAYLKGKALRGNLEAKEKFTRQADFNIRKYIIAISKSHDRDYSDVRNALALTATTLHQSNYQSHIKVVAIFSDLVHCPEDKRDKLQPLQIDNAMVLCVRPALTSKQLNKLFSQEVHVLTSSEDILSFIRSHQLN